MASISSLGIGSGLNLNELLDQLESAERQQLIVLLFEGARTSIRTAAIYMQGSNIAAKGKALDIANNGLLAALGHERGGEIAANLASPYDYIARQLIVANLHNDTQALVEAERLLGGIGEVWQTIGGKFPPTNDSARSDS